MKLDKIVYDVREGVRQYTDDSEISDNYIIYLYGIKRAKYLRQDLNNFQKTIDNSIKQSFCLDLELISANECGLSIDCGTILRTTKKIPKPIELHTKSAITAVKPSNILSVPFNFVTKERIAMLEGSMFKKGLKAFLDDDMYIYIVAESSNYKLLECINITGIFEDPLELKDYVNCCDCGDEVKPCFNKLESDYPLQPHYIDLIRREIINDLIQFLKLPEDKVNDSTN